MLLLPEQWVLLIVVGIGAGVMSGLFGIGGGIVIVPALQVFIGFTTIQATSISLAALLAPVGIFAVITYYRAGLMDLRAALIIAFGLAVTSFIGAQIGLALNDIDPLLLRRVYGAFMLIMSWRFLEPRKVYAEIQAARHRDGTPVAPVAEREPVSPRWTSLLMVGFGAGVLAGLMGIGGGVVVVPALVAIFAYPQKRAVGTSLGALLLPVGLPGVLAYGNAGLLDLGAAVFVAIGLVFGSIFGARIAIGLPVTTARRLYGLFLFAIGINFVVGG